MGGVLLLEVECPGDLDGHDLLLLPSKDKSLGGDLDGDLLLVLGLSSRRCQGSCLPLTCAFEGGDQTGGFVSESRDSAG